MTERQTLFQDALRLRQLSEKQTLTRPENIELAEIADRVHAAGVEQVSIRDTASRFERDAEAVAIQRDELYQRLHRIHAACESDADLAGMAVRDFLVRESVVAALPDVIVGLVPGSDDA